MSQTEKLIRDSNASVARETVANVVNVGGVSGNPPFVGGPNNPVYDRPIPRKVSELENDLEYITFDEMESISEGIKTGFVFNQMAASDNWVIDHNMSKFPSVTIVDSSGNVVYGEVKYIDRNSLNIVFNGSFSGKAYLN